MRASGSTTAFKRLSCPQRQRWRNAFANRRFPSNTDMDKPFFERKKEPARAAPTEVSFGPFRLLPTQFLLLEGDKPVSLGSRALEILIVWLNAQVSGQATRIDGSRLAQCLCRACQSDRPCFCIAPHAAWTDKTEIGSSSISPGEATVVSQSRSALQKPALRL